MAHELYDLDKDDHDNARDFRRDVLESDDIRMSLGLLAIRHLFVDWETSQGLHV